MQAVSEKETHDQWANPNPNYCGLITVAHDLWTKCQNQSQDHDCGHGLRAGYIHRHRRWTNVAAIQIIYVCVWGGGEVIAWLLCEYKSDTLQCTQGRLVVSLSVLRTCCLAAFYTSRFWSLTACNTARDQKLRRPGNKAIIIMLLQFTFIQRVTALVSFLSNN